MKAKFIMPEFVRDRFINFNLLDLMNRRPESVREKSSIYGFYGNFPGCIWNGGRYLIGDPQSSKDEIVEIFDIYNKTYKLPLRLTFTNPCIDNEKYCYDTYANLIAECGHNGMNEILVVSPILEKYLRENYPNYKYCRSVIAAKDQPYNLNNYYMSVLNKNWVNDFNKIDSIPVEERKKIEIICNDVCIDNCPRIYEHYNAIGESILNFKINPETHCTMYNFDPDFPIADRKERKKYVNYTSVINNYLPRNFQYFKLCGREDFSQRLFNWVNYIFEPKYQEDILSKIIRGWN